MCYPGWWTYKLTSNLQHLWVYLLFMVYYNPSILFISQLDNPELLYSYLRSFFLRRKLESCIDEKDTLVLTSKTFLPLSREGCTLFRWLPVRSRLFGREGRIARYKCECRIASYVGLEGKLGRSTSIHLRSAFWYHQVGGGVGTRHTGALVIEQPTGRTTAQSIIE